MKTLYENPWFRVVQDGRYHWIRLGSGRIGRQGKRAFLRDEILSKEKDHIANSIAQLRDDPETYNKTLQGWAKIALPNQSETNINVDIKQRADMFLRIKEQYGLSQAVDDAELLPDFNGVGSLPQPDIEDADISEETDEPTKEPVAIMVENQEEYEDAIQEELTSPSPHPTPVVNPRYPSRASTFDPTFFEIPDDTTPVGEDFPPY